MFKLSHAKFFLLIICSLFVFSCVSPTPVEKDENFLGDFNPVQLDNLFSLTYSKADGVKPVEMRAYFVPRSNTVELYYRILANEIVLMLDPEARQKIRESAQEYLDQYENGFLPVQTPSKKNALSHGTIFISWGLLGASRNTEASFWTNYEFLEEGKPYFMIYVNPTEDKNDSSAYSPKNEIYFSPSLLQDFLATTEQENLQSIVDSLADKAYRFE